MRVLSDVSINPPVISNDSLYIARKELAGVINKLGTERLFMPIAADLDPLWTGCVSEGWFNHPYPPFMTMFSVMKHYPKDFYEFVDGYVISGVKDYNDLRRSFNRVYMRALAGKGKGEPHGWCSPDEFLRIGALFFVLLKNADMAYGVTLNPMGYFGNEWSGAKRVVSLNKTVFDEWASRVKGCVFSALDREQFFFRAISDTEPGVTWLFNFTQMDVMSEEPDVMNMETLISSLDVSTLVVNRGGHMLMVLPNEEIVIDLLQEIYGFSVNLNSTRHTNGSLYLDTNVLSDRYILVSDV